MYLFIAPDGQIRGVEKLEDLKTPFKYAGYQGRAIEVSGVDVPLEQFKPKRPAGAPAPAPSVDVAALLAQNEQLMKQLIALQTPKPSAPAQP